MLLRSLRAIAALALVGAACSGTATQSTTTTTAGAVTTPTTPESSSTTTGPSTTDLVMDFTRIDDPSFDGGFLNAAVVAGPGLVAVGSDELPEDAAVWVSTDGSAWDRVESETFSGVKDADGLEGRQFMTDVVAGPDGIVAVGGYERRDARDLDPAVWISQDGLEWERIDDEDFAATGDGYLASVIDWNGTFIAVGEGPGPVGSGERRPAVWTSEDGREWVAAEGLALRVDATMSAITRRGSRLLAVGTNGHVGRPTVWFSDDGETWDMITSDDVADSMVGNIEIGDVGDQEDVFMNAVAVTPNGFVAAGATGFPLRTMFWESPDGLFWTVTGIVADVERSTMPVYVESIVTTGDGIVAVGTGRLDTSRFPPISFAQVWMSLDDGDTWAQFPRTSNSTAVAGPQSPWHIGAMHDVVAFDGGILAVGYVPFQDVILPGPFYHQAVWIGTWI